MEGLFPLPEFWPSTKGSWRIDSPGAPPVPPLPGVPDRQAAPSCEQGIVIHIVAIGPDQEIVDRMADAAAKIPAARKYSGHESNKELESEEDGVPVAH